jgi:hypothetical protein
VAGALGCLALHVLKLAGGPVTLGAAVALECGVFLAWIPAVALFVGRARDRFGSPFSPALVRAFFPTFFDGTPPRLRTAAIASAAYAALFLVVRWLWQLRDLDATPPSPVDPELTAVAFAFYVLAATVYAGAGNGRGPGPRAL